MFQQSVKYVDADHIAIKPVCDFFDINYRNQLDRIKKHEMLNQLCGKNHMVAFDNRLRSMYSFPKHGFLMWIYGINPKIVASHLRENFITFQMLVHEFVFGAVQNIEIARVNHQRLKKAKSLYGKIGNLIKQLEGEQSLYLESHFNQLKLSFIEN